MEAVREGRRLQPISQQFEFGGGKAHAGLSEERKLSGTGQGHGAGRIPQLRWNRA